MKKILLIILTCLLMCCSFSIVGCGFSSTTGAPNNEQQEEGIGFTLNENNTYTVSSYFGDDKIIVIPEVYEGIAVTEIEYNVFNELDNLEEITIPKNIEIMHEYAFSNCKNLKKINYNARNLKKKDNSTSGDSPEFITSPFPHDDMSTREEFIVNIGADVEKVPQCLFRGVGVTEINFETNSKLQEIGADAFSDATITKIVLPDNLKYLRHGAFSFCQSLTEITIPNSIEYIDGMAFYASSNIGTKYGNYTYVGNSENPYLALVSVDIDNSETSLTINKNTKFILDRVISDPTYHTIKNITLPEGLVGIGSYAICHCYDLYSIVIPKSVKYIDYYAFDGCSYLVVKCEVESKPTGWDEIWYKFSNSYNVKEVVWGYEK